jgi:hypothetical protein
MVDAQRALLDELMGVERDVPLAARSGRGAAPRWDDAGVCGYALAGLCPHRLFKNTRSDIGFCRWNRHEDWVGWEDVAAQWAALDPREKARAGHEAALHALIDAMVRDLERKIERARDRLAAQAAAAKPPPKAEVDAIDTLRARAATLVARADAAAAAGDADAALDATKQADDLVADAAAAAAAAARRGHAPQVVCDISGVIMAANESEARVKELAEGKQYIGWAAVRAELARLRERGGPLGRGGPPPRDWGRRDEHRDRDWDRDRDRDRERRRSRSRSPRRRR